MTPEAAMPSAGLGIDAAMGLRIEIGNLTAEMKTRRQREERQARNRPFPFRLIGNALTTPAQLNTATVTQVKLPQIVPTGYIWEVRQIALLAYGQAKVSDENGSDVIQETGSGFTSVHAAAAAAGTLTAAGLAYLSGWLVSPAAAWPAGDNTVTVSNLTGGTQTWEIPGGTTQPVGPGSYQQPIPAPYASPAIAVPAIATGPAYTINAWGQTLGSGFIDVAGSIFAGVPPPPPTATVRSTVDHEVVEPSCSLPFKQRYTPGELLLMEGETLYAEAWNVIGGGVILTARLTSYPPGGQV